MIYVVRPYVRESHITRIVMHCTGTILIIYQLTMVGIFLIKGFKYGVLVFVIMVISIAFIIYNHYRWSEPFYHMPLDQTDETHSLLIPTIADTRRFTMLFHHPALTPPDVDNMYSVTVGHTSQPQRSRKRGSRARIDENLNSVRGAGRTESQLKATLRGHPEITIFIESANEYTDDVKIPSPDEKDRTNTQDQTETKEERILNENSSICEEDFVYESLSSSDEIFAPLDEVITLPRDSNLSGLYGRMKEMSPGGLQRNYSASNIESEENSKEL